MAECVVMKKSLLIFSLSGGDIYNTNGAGQTLRRKTRKFRVKYRTVSPTAANITGAVVAGTATSGEMESAEVEAIEMEIKPIRSRQKNRNRTYRHTTQFVAVSTLDEDEKDCVRLITKAKY